MARRYAALKRAGCPQWYVLDRQTGAEVAEPPSQHEARAIARDLNSSAEQDAD